MQMSVKNRCQVLCFVFILSIQNFDVISFIAALSAQMIKNQTPLVFSADICALSCCDIEKKEGNDMKNQMPKINFSSFIICWGFFRVEI